MAGRPPKPSNLLELSGAFKKNPKRKAARSGEPVPSGPLGAPPAQWMIESPEAFGYQKAAELRQIWTEIASMAPWLTSADRHTVEDICVLRLKARKDTIKPGERNVLRALNNSCGLDASGRAKINTFPTTPRQAVASDPRDAYERGAKRG
jgi:hypothetical protein